MLQQLCKGFTRPFYWNEHKTEIPEQYCLIDFNFQRVNRLLVVAFENKKFCSCDKGYFLVRIDDGKNVFDPSINNFVKHTIALEKIPVGPGDDCRIGWLLDYSYFNKNYEPLVIDLSKQNVFEADPKK